MATIKRVGKTGMSKSTKMGPVSSRPAKAKLNYPSMPSTSPTRGRKKKSSRKKMNNPKY